MEALVTSALKGEIFLSSGVLIAFGVVPGDFPRINISANQQRGCASTARELGTVLEEFSDVFVEDLSGRRCLHGHMHI